MIYRCLRKYLILYLVFIYQNNLENVENSRRVIIKSTGNPGVSTSNKLLGGGGTIFFRKKSMILFIDFFLLKLLIPYQEIPPYNGFGSLEDSLQSCLSLVPQPPKKDFIRMLENDNKVLRYEATLVRHTSIFFYLALKESCLPFSTPDQ